jgi:hypothetical protein
MLAVDAVTTADNAIALRASMITRLHHFTHIK